MIHPQQFDRRHNQSQICPERRVLSPLFVAAGGKCVVEPSMRRLHAMIISCGWEGEQSRGLVGDACANHLRQKPIGIPRVPLGFSSTVGEKSNPLLAFCHLHIRKISFGQRSGTRHRAKHEHSSRSGRPSSACWENLPLIAFFPFGGS